MRCYCCNTPLSGAQAVRRFKDSNEFTDMCDRCLETISDDVETVDGDIPPEEDEEEEE